MWKAFAAAVAATIVGLFVYFTFLA